MHSKTDENKKSVKMKTELPAANNTLYKISCCKDSRNPPYCPESDKIEDPSQNTN